MSLATDHGFADLYYTGVGSRQTPRHTLSLIEQIARHLAAEGYIMRSGHAQGADQAFERGAGGNAEIFLPWKSFCYEVATQGKVFYEPTDAAMAMAEEIVGHWSALTPGGKKLHARNCHQVLGRELDSPVEFVVCWTRGGKITGGTATAIKLAKREGIRVYNLGRSKDLSDVCGWMT